MYKFIFADRVSPWFRWFAWPPVYTHDRGWRWLIWVWRSKYQIKNHIESPHSQFFVSVVDKSYLE